MRQAALRTSPFSERLLGAARANRSWLCVGLDPEPSDDVVPFVKGIVGLHRTRRSVPLQTTAHHWRTPNPGEPANPNPPAP